MEQGWLDGPDAFCVIYRPPYQPGHRVGLRRHIHDTDPNDYEPDTGRGYASGLSPMFAGVGPDGEGQPVEFGRTVAEYDIGEPLGGVTYLLRMDTAGVGWWGALQTELPHTPNA